MAHIQRVWNLEPRPHHHIGWIVWWHDAISRSVRFLCIYGTQLAIYRRWSYDVTTKALCVATKALALNPFDSTLQLRLAKLHHQKQVTDSHSARGAQFKARLHWLKVGDRASKEFFLALRAHYTSVGIKKIKEGQALLTELPDIFQAFVYHYEKVFTMQGDSPARTQALQDCLAVVPKQLSDSQRAFCDLLLTIDDLKEATFSMADDKTPRCDGFPYEFYKSLWPCVGPNLHKVYLEAFHSHSLGKMIN